MSQVKSNDYNQKKKLLPHFEDALKKVKELKVTQSVIIRDTNLLMVPETNSSDGKMFVNPQIINFQDRNQSNDNSTSNKSVDTNSQPKKYSKFKLAFSKLLGTKKKDSDKNLNIQGSKSVRFNIKEDRDDFELLDHGMIPEDI